MQTTTKDGTYTFNLEAVFLPRTILRCGKLTSSLPGPWNDVQDASNMSSNQDCSLISDTEEKILREVTEAFKKRQEIFAIDETKMMLQFHEQQQAHVDRYSEMEREHMVRFNQDQRERGSQFEGSEATRVCIFRAGENTRLSLFNEAQIRRETELAGGLKAIIDKTRRQEIERAKVFAGWELSVRAEFTELMARWKEEFVLDEEKNC